MAVTDELKLRLVGDLLEPSDFAILVVPIDKAAPKGRLILPQQQTIRDVLEAGAAAIVIKEDELSNNTGNLGEKTKACDHRQPGLCQSGSEETPEDILAYFILYSVCQI